MSVFQDSTSVSTEYSCTPKIRWGTTDVCLQQASKHPNVRSGYLRRKASGTGGRGAEGRPPAAVPGARQMGQGEVEELAVGRRAFTENGEEGVPESE